MRVSLVSGSALFEALQLTSTSPFGSSVYTPATDQIKAEFNVSSEVARLPFVLYLLFLAFGPILAAPISETLGRRSVYLTGLPLLAVVSLGAGFSNSIVTLSILRSFAGLFASPGLSIGTGVIADLWAPEQRMIPMSTYVFLVQLGPALG
jgi:MFS family permease